MPLPASSFSDWLTQPALRLLTLMLFHFLWKGAAIAGVLTIFVELVGLRRATSRYACSLTALVVMILCPAATWMWYSEVWYSGVKPSSSAFVLASEPLAEILAPAAAVDLQAL